MSKKKQKKACQPKTREHLKDIAMSTDIIIDQLDEVIQLLQTLVEQTKSKTSTIAKPVRREPDFSINVNPVAPVSKQLVEEYQNDPQTEVVRDYIDSELLKSISDEKERYHAYRDKPLPPYVRVHEAP
ncbi:hypothetical protein SEA_DUSSY_39 [Mycobacterium phage Dussy]|nr:hypothetical protein SEA_DUSSY_39 [Mycobacterium phage Dussy]UJQ86961.1 hypothetical protein SEA_ABBYSHOES_40 [Mycobacterium phage Abbyshoes]UVD39633.1 hypothetical protein SEA_KENMECH_41 [Mycobacterium phage Kenmech]